VLNFNSKHLKHLGKIFLSALTLTVFTVVPYLSNYILMKQAMAASLTSAKLTISDSRAAQTAVTHEFKFTTATGGSIKHVDFTYCTTATGACSAVSGLNFALAGTGPITGLGAGSVSSPTANVSLRYTVSSAALIGSGTAVTIPFTNITNPSGTNSTFFVRIETKDAGLAVIDNVSVASAVLTTTSISVSASIGAAFTFTVAAVSSGSVNGRTIDIVTTQNAIPFGAMVNGDVQVGAHDLTVSTNATNGYSVTVKTLDDPPLADMSNNIDNFTGTNSSPVTWSAPTSATANSNTGYFGYTTEDSSLSAAAADRFTSSGGNKWSGFTTTPAEVIYRANSTVGAGETTRLGWIAEVNSNQPAGEYRGTVILVATPTY
jgi:hypothetical protein